MASITRVAAGFSSEQMECRDEIITHILSRVSAEDVQCQRYGAPSFLIQILLISITRFVSENRYFVSLTDERLVTNSRAILDDARTLPVPLLQSPNGSTCAVVYNPVRRFLKKMSMHFKVDIGLMYFAEICYKQNSLKFVMASFSVSEKPRYNVVFDSHSDSWYEDPPPLRSIEFSDYDSNFLGITFF